MANFYRKNQSGRSMIEMLGVLAIIAVLSVGGIAAYTKAMGEYRWNKALEQWNSIIGLMNQYKSQLNLSDRSRPESETSLLPLISNFSDLPAEMRTNDKDIIKDALGNKMRIYAHGTGYIGIRSSTTEENSSACRIFLTMGQYHHALVERVLIYTLGGGEQSGNVYYGDRKCRNGVRCLKNIGPADIAAICKENPVCKDKSNCNFLMYWF